MDLTLILRAVESRPEQRLERAFQAQVLVRESRTLTRVRKID
jgi:hypothetical protein